MADIETRDPRMGDVFEAGAPLEQVGTGYAFTEGPIWNPVTGVLIFSDMPGDHMRALGSDGVVSTFRQPSDMANGNAYDRQGRIVTCQHATSTVTRTEADGEIVTLASHWEGRELNSPNDVIVGPDGAIWFTDPSFGRMEYYGRPREQELDFQGVYRIDPSGALSLVADDFTQPNGLCFSLDRESMFVNDTGQGHIRRFQVRADGTLGGGEVWATPQGEGDGAPDGMKIDRLGRLFCTGPGGVHVIAEDATPLGVLRVPEVVANFTWGGADLRTLYMTASTSLYAIRTVTPGVDLFGG